MPTSVGILYPLAEPRAGYSTTAQAAQAGVSRQQLYYLTWTGSLDRVAHGIYRLRRFPAQRFEDVIVACLWVGEDVDPSGVVHQRGLRAAVAFAASGRVGVGRGGSGQRDR